MGNTCFPLMQPQAFLGGYVLPAHISRNALLSPFAWLSSGLSRRLLTSAVLRLFCTRTARCWAQAYAMALTCMQTGARPESHCPFWRCRSRSYKQDSWRRLSYRRQRLFLWWCSGSSCLKFWICRIIFTHKYLRLFHQWDWCNVSV